MSTRQICTACNFVGYPVTVTKGHFVLEVALWLLYIVPGLLYSIWRLTTRHKACPVCGCAQLIPTSSPAGKRLMSLMGLASGQDGA